MPLEKTVWEINGRKKLGKPTGSALNRGADEHPSTIGIGWTWVRVEYDENVMVPVRKSKFQAGDNFRGAGDNDDC